MLPVPLRGRPSRARPRSRREASAGVVSTPAADADACRSGNGSMTMAASESMSDRPDEMSLGIDGFAQGASRFLCVRARGRAQAWVRMRPWGRCADVLKAWNCAQVREPGACSFHLASPSSPSHGPVLSPGTPIRVTQGACHTMNIKTNNKLQLESCERHAAGLPLPSVVSAAFTNWAPAASLRGARVPDGRRAGAA